MMAKRLFYTVIVIACLSAYTFAFAEQVSIVQTFDSDQITDYTLEYTDTDKKIRLYYTMDKSSQHASIKYNPSNRDINDFKTLEPLLFKLIQRADGISTVKIVGFATFEFLRCDDIAQKAVLAFYDSQIWKKYLRESKKKYVRPPYDFIQKRMNQAAVFKDLNNLFLRLGYTAEFHSFEKLAVRKAGEFNFYQDLKPYGIMPDDKFPVPLMLYFKLIRK